MTKEIFEAYRGVAHPWHADEMGHVTTRFYTGWFDDAGYHLMAKIGGDTFSLKRLGLGWADVRCVVEYKKEMLSSDLFYVNGSILKLGNTSLTTRLEMHRVDGTLLATTEMTTVQFDLDKRCAVPLHASVRDAAEKLLINCQD